MRKLRILLFSLSLLVCSISFGQGKISAEAQMHYTRGVTTFDNNDYQGALAHFKNALKASPNFAQAHISMAYCLIALDDYQGAENSFIIASNSDPYSDVALYELGKLKERKGELEQAVDFSNRAIQIKRDEARYYYQRGVQFFKLERYGESIQDFSHAIALNPNFMDAFNDRGSANRLTGDLESAINDYDIASKGATGKLKVIALNNLGSTYREVKEYNKSLEALNEAVSLDGSNYLVLNNRGLAKYYTKDYEGAIVDFERVIQLKPDFALAYSNLAGIYSEIRNFEKVVEYSTQAIEKDANLANAYYNRAIAYEIQRNVEQACADWKRASELGIKQAGENYNTLNCDK